MYKASSFHVYDNAFAHAKIIDANNIEFHGWERTTLQIINCSKTIYYTFPTLIYLDCRMCHFDT